ncbi:ABC transporter [Leptolyngbya sp. 'hensonii']|nr:ABC transporter [Leptolyngbya sp. 'hensonii']
MLVKGHLHAFREIVALLNRHKFLAWEMAKREITDRYRGQLLGTFWAVMHPLTLIMVYVFIFVVVFKIKLGGNRDMPLDYTAYLLAGLIPWLGCQEVLAKASTAITGSVNLVKQVVFPIEILPIKGVISSIINQIILLVLLGIYVLISHHSLPWTYCFIPLLLIVQTLGMMGTAFMLSAVGVYFRDVKDVMQVFIVIGVYLLPVFYLPAQVPSAFKPILYINPFSYLIWCYQDALYFGRFEHPYAWAILILLSHIILVSGYRLFRRLKIMFGSVL